MTDTTAADETELELKLEIDPADIAALAESAALAGIEATVVDHVSTYYDTPAQDLRQAGVSLRVRSSGTRHVQTIKAGGGPAAGLFARAEWECDVAGPALELDDESPIRTFVTDDVLARVVPVFAVAIQRRRWLVDRDGGIVELVVDTGTVAAGVRATPVSEIELELKSGAPAAIFALVHALSQDVPLRLGVLTKSERGYRLIGPMTPGAVKAERMELAPDATVAEAFEQIVAACLRHFRLNETLLLRTPGPDALHQARVALRRLRSALSIFKPVVAGARFARLAAELKWLGGVLGEARDLDVLIARIGDAAPAALIAAHGAAYAAVRDALDSARTRQLMLELVEWAALGAWRTTPDDPRAIHQPAFVFAAATLDRLRTKVERRGRHLERLDDAPRHRLRIAAKKLRYAVGFFESLCTGKKARRRIKAFSNPLEKLQDRLGALNDLATAPALLDRFHIDASPAASDDRGDLLDKAAKAHGRLIEARRFW